MATGTKKGLNVGRTAGNGPDNKGFSTKKIASAYGTSLFTGDPVKITNGNVVLATNGADAVGVFIGCSYVDTTGTPQESPYFPAATTGNIEAKVVDNPNATFIAKGTTNVSQVVEGNIYSMTIPAGDTYTGHSNAVVDTVATLVGALNIAGETDLGANTAMDDTDTFTVKSSSNAGAATSITIADGDGTDTLLAKINAVPNVFADLTPQGYLRIVATDGYSLVTANTVGTPLTDMSMTAGTLAPTKAANAGMVRVIKVIDPATLKLEVQLVNHSLRDDG